MTLALERAGVRAPVGGEDCEEALHLVCCRDEDLALCGVDLTGQDWVVPQGMPMCWACDGLDGGRCVKVLGRWLRCVAVR